MNARSEYATIDASSATFARVDRVTLRVLGSLAALCTLLAGALTVAGAARFLWASEVSLSLLADTPVESTSPVSTAAHDSVSLTTSALSAAARGLLATGDIASALTILAVGGAIAVILFLAAARRPFRPMLFPITLTAGFALAVGPILAVGLHGLGLMHAAGELSPAVDAGLVTGFGIPGLGAAVPLVGFAVLALAFVFRHGAALQRDTEGLV